METATERSLDHIIGEDNSNCPVRYTTTFFEDRIEQTISKMLFGNMGFRHFNSFDIGSTRWTDPNHLGVACTYVRTLAEKGDDMINLNDYRRIEEKVRFSKGRDKVTLKKGQYKVEFEYAGADETARKAVIDAYKSFSGIVERSTGKPLQRPLEIEQTGNAIIAKFGSAEDKFNLEYELTLQYMILSNFIDAKKKGA